MSSPFPDFTPEVLRSRLVALIASRGIRLGEIAKRSGRTHGWVYHRLSEPQTSKRAITPISEADLTTILSAAGIQAEQLTRPVLYACDYSAMADVMALTLIRVIKDRYGRFCVKRLLSQGFIATMDRFFVLTEAGDAELRRHAADPKAPARKAEAQRRIRQFAADYAGRLYFSRGLLWLVESIVASQIVSDTGADPEIATPGVGPLRRGVRVGPDGVIFSGRKERQQTVEQIVDRLSRWSGDLS